MSDVRAIFVADLHLQAKPPVCRSAEPDWFEAMARPLKELQGLVDEYKVPVLYAGDIFDRWDARPEVVNFALTHLPPGYAVPGQHDLPNHSYDEIKRSAYWTLVEAERLINIPIDDHIVIASAGLVVYGFPWGYPPRPLSEEQAACKLLSIALIHRFIYTKTTGYPGAPPEARVPAYKAALAGYDAAVFGDNHKGFIQPGNPTICNCGGFMRRKVDERDYRPGVGLLHTDGTVTRHYFDTSEDAFAEISEAEEAVAKVLDMSAFVDGLRGLESDDALDFIAAMERFIRENDVPQRVAEIMIQASEGNIE